MQISALILTIREGGSVSSYMITVLSMTFTVVSIMLSVFEHKMKSKFLKAGCVIAAIFSFESKELASIRMRQFESRVVFKKHQIVNSVAKCVELSKEQVERLIPLQHKHGATFTFIMELTHQSHFENVAHLLNQGIDDNSLNRVKFVCLCHSIITLIAVFLNFQKYTHMHFFCRNFRKFIN